MKIAMTNAFLPTDQRSGVPYQVHHLANALTSRGHTVTVFSFSPKPSDAKYETRPFGRPQIPQRFWPFVMAYRLRQADFSEFDILHTHGDNYLIDPKLKHVRTFHGSARDEMRHAKTLRRRAFFFITMMLEQIGARVATINVGVSETTRYAFRNIRVVIPCGVDLSAFRPSQKSDEPTVLFVGSETGRKRGAWLAEIFSREVVPRVPEARLLMVTDIEKSEPGISRLGRVSNERLSDLYGSAWVFCLPSTYEGFGVPYIEAMASKTAVIATSQNPGAAEVLANGNYGALVTDAALGTTLVELLTMDRRRTELEEAGLTRSLVFGWDRVTAAYEQIYDSLSNY